MSNPAVEPGHTIAGRYRIECLLGQGAMGSVYRAVQLSIGRPVALKRLTLEGGERQGLIERFEREARALSLLSHPNTVRLFDYGTDEGGAPFIVMELLRGSDLAEDLVRQGPLRWDQALRVVQAVAGSLGEAHRAGIVHRDIKPANVFLCAGSAWPALKVLDFGIAGELEPEGARKLTRTGTVVGSAAYMSPEQAQGQTVSASSDLYALGVLAFEAMTARTPFDERSFTAQLVAKVVEPAPALRDVCPTLDVPEGVEALIRDLLDRDPARRPDAEALIARCEALLVQSTLGPIAREVLVAAPSPSVSGVAKTEPMPVANTLDDGWAPPRTGSAPQVRVEGSRRRPIGQWLGLGAVAIGLGVGLVWALGSRAAVRDPSHTTAALERAPEQAVEPMPEPVQEQGPEQEHATPPSPSPDVVGSTRLEAADPGEPAGPEGAPAEGAPAEGAPAVAPPRPSAEQERVERTVREAAPRTPKPQRYPHRAAVLQAEREGKITPVERNRHILRLNALQAEALARLRRDARDGRISAEELEKEEAALELRFGGPPPAGVPGL